MHVNEKRGQVRKKRGARKREKKKRGGFPLRGRREEKCVVDFFSKEKRGML